jgi:hypothetical protein
MGNYRDLGVEMENYREPEPALENHRDSGDWQAAGFVLWTVWDSRRYHKI